MVSHKPLYSIEMYVVGRQGLEPRTKGLKIRRGQGKLPLRLIELNQKERQSEDRLSFLNSIMPQGV
jgi:hypothetical protein